MKISRRNILTAMVVVGQVLVMSCGKSTASVSDSGEVGQAVGSVSDKPEVAFDTDSAMYFIKSQVDFGPRVPGSDAHKKTADWLSSKLAFMGAEVDDKVVAAVHPVSGENLEVRNIFGRFNVNASDRILLLAHYDTRPWADEDANSENHTKPIDGANDGASGVAVALEVARHADHLPSGLGLDVLFVDMEDSGTKNNDETWCIGSREWACNLPYATSAMPRFGILLDMVGGKDAKFSREYFSEQYASMVNDLVWGVAARSGYGNRFVNNIGGAINDDHLSLINAGIPTIDIIEMNTDNGSGFNRTWHTLDDNYENIDPKTIEAVGVVLTNLIYNKK